MQKRFFCLILMLGLALALAVPAIAGDVPGVTKNAVKIGQWGPQTGPAALWGSVCRGTGLYFRMVNEAGGINGRKIDYYMRDDGYQPNKTKAIVKELVEKEGVWGFVGGVGTSPGMAVMPYLVERNIPWVSPASGSTHWAFPPKPNLWSTYSTFPVDAILITRYAIDTLKKSKIGFIYQNDDYGKGGLIGVEKELRDRGMKLAAAVPTEITETDLSSQVLKLKDAGCDVVIAWLLPKQAAITLGTAAKMGFKPQFMAPSALGDSELMYKITKGLWKDVIFASYIDLVWSEDNPALVKFREAWKKFTPEERFGPFLVVGAYFAETMVEGLKRCGDDLSYENFIKSMESLKNFQGIGAPITFGPNKRQGCNSLFMVVCDPSAKGMARKLTDWMTVENFSMEWLEK